MFDLDGRQLGSESGVDCGSPSQIVVNSSVGVGVGSGGVAIHSRVSVGLTIRLVDVRVVKGVVSSSGRGRSRH